MKLQYTPQTARILKTIKPAEPQIDFDNIDKIEKKLKEQFPEIAYIDIEIN